MCITVTLRPIPAPLINVRILYMWQDNYNSFHSPIIMGLFRQ